MARCFGYPYQAPQALGDWESGDDDGAGSTSDFGGLVDEGQVVEQNEGSMCEDYTLMQNESATLDAISNRVIKWEVNEVVGPLGSVEAGGASGSVASEVPVVVPLPKRNTMTLYEVEKLRFDYSIPTYVGLRLPKDGETPKFPDDESVMIFPETFKHGLRLPLHPWVQMMLSKLGYAPGQYNPNFWIILHSVYISWWLVGLGEPSFEQLMYLYSITRQQGRGGWVQTNCRMAGQRGYFITNMPSAQKTWRNKWCMAYGDWEKPPNHFVAKNIPNSFQSIGPLANYFVYMV